MRESWPPAVILERDGVRLEPLSLAHHDGLANAAADGELWNLTFTSVPAPGETAAYIQNALNACVAGDRFAFAVIDGATEQVIGSTGYHDIVPDIRRLAIGYTWYARRCQRTRINTTCKLMLMSHAFDTLECPVVAWQTDILNVASQAAIAKLGALRDGIIRCHMRRRDGTLRDTVLYSMLRSEWPHHRDRLEARLRAGGFETPRDPG